MESAGFSEMADVIDTASGKIIQKEDFVSSIQQPLGQMRTNKSGTACDQESQGRSPRSWIRLSQKTGQVEQEIFQAAWSVRRKIADVGKT